MPNKWSKTICLSIFVMLMTDGALGQSLSGAYQSEHLRANLLPRKDGNYDVSIMVNTGNCAGNVDFVTTKMDGVLVGEVDKYCAVALGEYGGRLVIREKSCANFHGASCDFKGEVTRVGPANPNASKEFDSIVQRSTAEFVKSVKDGAKQARDRRSKEVVPEQPLVEGETRIESSGRARVIVDGEYLGVTPITVRLGGNEPAWARSDIVVKALPYDEGCVQVEVLSAGRRIPKRMFLDTRLCPIAPSLDVNVR